MAGPVRRRRLASAHHDRDRSCVDVAAGPPVSEQAGVAVARGGLRDGHHPMTVKSTTLTDELREYLLRVGVREPPVMARLRSENDRLPEGVHDMPIAPEQAALMAFLIETVGAKRCLELGTFTGYSSLAVALALPPDGRILCCDVSAEWTGVALRFWAEAGVSD